MKIMARTLKQISQDIGKLLSRSPLERGSLQELVGGSLQELVGEYYTRFVVESQENKKLKPYALAHGLNNHIKRDLERYKMTSFETIAAFELARERMFQLTPEETKAKMPKVTEANRAKPKKDEDYLSRIMRTNTADLEDEHLKLNKLNTRIREKEDIGNLLHTWQKEGVDLPILLNIKENGKRPEDIAFETKNYLACLELFRYNPHSNLRIATKALSGIQWPEDSNKNEAKKILLECLLERIQKHPIFYIQDPEKETKGHNTVKNFAKATQVALRTADQLGRTDDKNVIISSFKKHIEEMLRGVKKIGSGQISESNLLSYCQEIGPKTQDHKKHKGIDPDLRKVLCDTLIQFYVEKEQNDASFSFKIENLIETGVLSAQELGQFITNNTNNLLPQRDAALCKICRNRGVKIFEKIPTQGVNDPDFNFTKTPPLRQNQLNTSETAEEQLNPPIKQKPKRPDVSTIFGSAKSSTEPKSATSLNGTSRGNSNNTSTTI